MRKTKKDESKPFVIVRGYRSGVTTGFLEDRTPGEIVLSEARRVWRWAGANTLFELANHGASMTETTRISEPTGRVVLERSDVCEVIDVSPEAQKNLRASRWL